jgi:hypothetical protein
MFFSVHYAKAICGHALLESAGHRHFEFSGETGKVVLWDRSVQ